jgi:curli biogenesis system outer membrane secretion channel CsgG
MTMKRAMITICAWALALVMTAGAQTKRSMAVESFDYSTVMTPVQSIFGTSVDVGQGISSLMINRIARDGKFTVVERRKIANVMKEQDFDASNRVKKGTGARIGQIRGAELTLMGDIVVFGRDDRKKGGAAGVIVPGAGGVAGGYKKTDKAVVVLAYRLVDNESSEIVASGEARGESKRESKGGFAGMFVGGVLAGGGFGSNASNFAETIIGEAVIDAVDHLAQDLNQHSSGAASAKRDIEIDALVAAVSGGSVTINAGSAAGVAVGDKLQVLRKIREVKDPVTKEVLDVETQPVGELVIVTVRERIATGAYTGQPAQVGDLVRNK